MIDEPISDCRSNLVSRSFDTLYSVIMFCKSFVNMFELDVSFVITIILFHPFSLSIYCFNTVYPSTDMHCYIYGGLLDTSERLQRICVRKVSLCPSMGKERALMLEPRFRRRIYYNVGNNTEK